MTPQPTPPAFRLAHWLLCLLCLNAMSASAQTQAAPPTAFAQPEAATDLTAQTGHHSQHFAVATANPLATQAAHDTLKHGGSAIDAAIAAQMVLTLVEPQSSGIGGGAFLLHFDGQHVQAFDGRETAPAGATPELFMQGEQPLPFKDAVQSGLSVGVPGVLRMLELAHSQHGKLPWAQLFEPAIALAENGFAISPRLHKLLAGDAALRSDPVAARYFYDTAGQAHPIGHVLKNPELAFVLRQLAKAGASALHQGEVAQAIVRKVQNHPSRPGTLGLADLANYQAKERPPLCFDEATAKRIVTLCGFPPPSSGALAMAQIFGILQYTQASVLPLQNGLPSAHWLHLYTEAARLAFADRALYVADPDFVAAPGNNWQSLIAPPYLQSRAKLIGEQSMKQAQPGSPAPDKLALAPMPEQAERGTSHISIVDKQGRALAMTTTIEDAFGSRLMVNRGAGLAGGFLLNNQLTDFSFRPQDAQGRPIANRVEPGKRPRSSMSPTLVFDKTSGQLIATLGSPGGAAIIHYTSKTAYALLHWQLNAQQAINLPNFGTFNGPTVLEAQCFPQATKAALAARGHDLRETDMTSGIQAIERTPQGWFGGADPRREGRVMGD